jgi:hypothetical protein
MVDDGLLHRGSLPGRDTIGRVSVEAHLLVPRGLLHAFEGPPERLANGAPTARRVVLPSPRTRHQPSMVEAP